MLPMSGLAATGLAGQSPMQESMPMHDHGASPAAMAGCDMMMKSSKAGKAKHAVCSAMAQCQFASIFYPPVRPTVMHPMPAGNQAVFHYVASLSVREPGGFWRPPRSI
ncbi:MAG: hypothetical protein EPN70_01745 [Paraburkholderia sp.]|nr:MAG: hypothetical protein EPN70_01745 [Paraburkholderia sp.]TAM31563.1 MAG: hypothetical protein EPN59_05130 [Paraburkholderia sp.]